MFALKAIVTVANVIMILSQLVVLFDRKEKNGKGVYAVLSALFFANTLFIWY